MGGDEGDSDWELEGLSGGEGAYGREGGGEEEKEDEGIGMKDWCFEGTCLGSVVFMVLRYMTSRVCLSLLDER